MENSRGFWNNYGVTLDNAWYLDPIVAEHKRQNHLALLRRWIGNAPPGRILKTDLFEESHKTDQILIDPLFISHQITGFDLAFSTVRKARANYPASGRYFWAGDVRQLGLAAESIDCVLSISTLDHFCEPDDFYKSLDELIRVIRPGGALILTLDNPCNPLYWILRLASRLRFTPYPLGFSLSLKRLRRVLQGKGLEVVATDLLIHNPRGFSTVLFIAVRRIMGKHADDVLRWLLKSFDLLGALPTRYWTACFIGIYAHKGVR
jgi:SAM-dependent methyltransferase